MIAGAAAVALAAVAGAAGGSAASATAAAVLVASALAFGIVTPVFAALVVLAGVFTEGGQALPAPIYAGVLLLTAELAFWVLDERDAGRVEPAVGASRLRGILVLTAAGVAASTVVLLASETDTTRSPAASAAGVAAILGCVGVLAILARSHQR